MPHFLLSKLEALKISDSTTAVAENAEVSIEGLQAESETVEAEHDEAAISAEQTRSLLEQKYLCPSSECSSLKSGHSLLDYNLQQGNSELAQVQAEKLENESVMEPETKMCSAKDAVSTTKQGNLEGMYMVSKLADLCKKHLEELAKKAGDLVGIINTLENHLSQVESECIDKPEKEAAAAAKVETEKESSELKEKFSKCEAEPDVSRRGSKLDVLPPSSFTPEALMRTANTDNVAGGSHAIVPYVGGGVSGAAFVTSFPHDGLSLAKLCASYLELASAVWHEQLVSVLTEAILEHVQKGKASVIVGEQAEHKRTVELMKQKLQESFSEPSYLKKSLEAAINSRRELAPELKTESTLMVEEAAATAVQKDAPLGCAVAEITSLKEETSNKVSQIAAPEVQVSVLKEDLEREHQRACSAQANYERWVIWQSQTIEMLTDKLQSLASVQEEAFALQKMAVWDDMEKSMNEAEKYGDGVGVMPTCASSESAIEVCSCVLSYLCRSKEKAENEISSLKQDKLCLQIQLEGALKKVAEAAKALLGEPANSRSFLFTEDEAKALKLQDSKTSLLKESSRQLGEETDHDFEKQRFFAELKSEIEQLQATRQEKDDVINQLRQHVSVKEGVISKLEEDLASNKSNSAEKENLVLQFMAKMRSSLEKQKQERVGSEPAADQLPKNRNRCLDSNCCC